MCDHHHNHDRHDHDHDGLVMNGTSVAGGCGSTQAVFKVTDLVEDVRSYLIRLYKLGFLLVSRVTSLEVMMMILSI